MFSSESTRHPQQVFRVLLQPLTSSDAAAANKSADILLLCLKITHLVDDHQPDGYLLEGVHRQQPIHVVCASMSHIPSCNSTSRFGCWGISQWLPGLRAQACYITKQINFKKMPKKSYLALPPPSLTLCQRGGWIWSYFSVTNGLKWSQIRGRSETN